MKNILSKSLIFVLILSAILFLSFLFWGNSIVNTFQGGATSITETTANGTKSADNDGVVLSVKETESCIWKPDRIDDGYKSCNSIIEVNNSQLVDFVMSPLLSTRFNMSMTSKETERSPTPNAVIRNQSIKYFWSNTFKDGWTNWQDFSKIDLTKISPKEIIAIKAVYEIPKYSEAHYNFMIKGTTKDATIDPNVTACGDINASGVYTINQSITSTGLASCINVYADNVNITCINFGNYISHTLGTYAIYSNSSRTNIQNCNITSGSLGHSIYLDKSNNSYIYANLLNTPYKGIELVSSYYGQIMSNTFKNNIGVYAGTGQSSFNNITSNTITATNAGSTPYGIYIVGDGNRISSNSIRANGTSASDATGIYVQGNWSIISGNSPSNGYTSIGSYYGVNILGNDNNITSNDGSNNYASSHFYGIYVTGNRNLISSSEITPIYTLWSSSGIDIVYVSGNSNNISSQSYSGYINASSFNGIALNGNNNFLSNNYHSPYDSYYPTHTTWYGDNIQGNNNTINVGTSDAYYVNYAHSFVGDNNTLTRASPSFVNYSVYISGNNNNVSHSNLENSNYYDVYVNSGTNNNFINDSYTQESVTSNGNLTRWWYLDIQVNATSNNSAISDVNVSSYNRTGNIYTSSLTGANGLTNQLLISYLNIGGTSTYYSNYTINASKAGWANKSISLNMSTNRYYNFFLEDTAPPKIYITSPTSNYYSYNTSISLNYTIVEQVISSCWYYILNSTNGYEISNKTLTNCQNATFNVSDEKTFTLYLYANDSSNQINFSSVTFGVSTTKPSITLDYPKNSSWLNYKDNVYFNFTAIQPSGLSTCELWGNWTGTWHKNYTWISPNSAVMNFTQVNLTEGYYKYNVWCNNSANVQNFALNNNSFGVDITFPSVIIPYNVNTTFGSQTINFTYNITELNPSICFYSIFNSLGAIDGTINNVTINCSDTSRQEVVTGFATYNLIVYARDLAGNENSTNRTFTTSTSTSHPTGGGGITIITLGMNNVLLSTNFSMTEPKTDIALAKKSVKPRNKVFYMINKETAPLDVTLVCDTTDVNQSTRAINICDYVSFTNISIIISGNEEQRAEGEFKVMTPPNSNFGDVYYFNILAVHQAGQNLSYYAKMSVSTKVSFLATIFYKWSYVPHTQKMYPVAPVSIFLSFLVFIGIFLLFSKVFKLFVTGLILSVILFLASFFLLAIFL